jgi:hypothetical protein
MLPLMVPVVIRLLAPFNECLHTYRCLVTHDIIPHEYFAIRREDYFNRHAKLRLIAPVPDYRLLNS